MGEQFIEKLKADGLVDYCKGECSGALFEGELYYCAICGATICHDGECFDWHWKHTHDGPVDKDQHQKGVRAA